MNRSFFYRHFKYWLKVNRSKFLVEPYIAHVRKNSFRVYFRGCKGLIFLKVNRWGEFSIWSYFKSEIVNQHFVKFYGETDKDENVLMDWCWDFDYFLKKNALDVFYCDYCTDKSGNTSETFSSRSKFLIKHSYVPFLNWCNEILFQADCIAFYENYTKIGQKKTILNATLPHEEREFINALSTNKKDLNANDQPIYIFDKPKKSQFRILGDFEQI